MHSGRFEGEGLLDVVAIRSGPTHDKPYHSSGTSYRGSSHTHSQQSLLPLALPLHAEACLVVRRTISTFQLHCAERYVAGCSHTGAWQPAIAEFAQGRYCLMHLVRREKGGGLL